MRTVNDRCPQQQQPLSWLRSRRARARTTAGRGMGGGAVLRRLAGVASRPPAPLRFGGARRLARRPPSAPAKTRSPDRWTARSRHLRSNHENPPNLDVAKPSLLGHRDTLREALLLKVADRVVVRVRHKVLDPLREVRARARDAMWRDMQCTGGGRGARARASRRR